ncbi:MAG: hypothetical protein J1E42_00060 [Akkermansiaceae bacterium]|nr:hypothetical protein [Akkermansiaceae bacterium]
MITLLEKAQEGDAQAQYELGMRYYKLAAANGNSEAADFLRKQGIKP